MATTVSFGRIAYHNFMSFADQTWDFGKSGEIFLISGKNLDLKEDESGVAASNGSGKTNLVQGLMYALYGQFPSKVHNANIVNKYSRYLDSEGYVMRVTLEVSIGSDNYVIVRGMVGNPTGTTRLTVYRTNPDGSQEDISKSSSALTQEFLNGILGMDFQTFQRLVMMSVDSSFNFFQMTAGQKRELIEQLFDTGTFAAMWDVIRKDQSRLAMTLQANKVKMNALEVQLSDYEGEIRKFKESSNAQIESLREELEKARVAGKAYVEQSKKAGERRQELERKLSETTEKIDAVRVKLGEIRAKSASIRVALSSEDQKISGYSREIGRHKDILEILCDDCRSRVRDTYKMDEYERLILESESKKTNIRTAMKRLFEAEQKASSKIDALSEQANSVRAEVRRVSDEEMNSKLMAGDTASTMKGLKERISELEAGRESPLEGARRATEASVAESRKAIAQNESEMSVLSMCESIVSPDAIRNNIVSRVVDGVNDLVNRRLEELNTTIRCEFDPQLDKCKIVAPGGWVVDYQNLSKGERMKLLLSVNLAFREFLLLRLNIRCNCLVFDEIVDQNFDTLSISRIMDMLLRMSRRDGTHVYIISHRGEVSTLADNLVENAGSASVERVLVEKKDNISTASSIF